MINLESYSSASPATARRIHNRSKHASRGAAKAAPSISAAAKPIRVAAKSQSPRCANTSLRVKPRRQFRLRNLLRSTVLMGVGVIIGACSIWHPHAVAGGTQRFHVASGILQTKVLSPATFGGMAARSIHSSGLWTAVQPGDTVWSLADRYGSPDRSIRDTVQDILRWNHLHLDASLHVGQSIQVAE